MLPGSRCPRLSRQEVMVGMHGPDFVWTFDTQLGDLEVREFHTYAELYSVVFEI